MWATIITINKPEFSFLLTCEQLDIGSTGEADSIHQPKGNDKGARIGLHPLRGRTKECKGIDPV
jgi:hypothetical protein